MAYMKDASGVRLDTIEVVRKPAARRAFAPLTAPNTVSTTLSTSFPGLSLTQRTGTALAVNTLRWRVHFRNVDLLTGTVYTTPCTVSGMWTGDDPVMVSGAVLDNRWAGDFSTAPDQLTAAALAVPTDGGFATTEWFDASDEQFTAGDFKGLGWNLAWTATGNGIAAGNSYLGVRVTGAHAADATLTAPTVGAQNMYLNVVLEYEFVEPCEVWITPGDSNTIGYAPAEQTSTTIMNPLSAGSCYPSEAWPGVAGAAAGAVVINLGVGSATPAHFASPTSLVWYASLLASVEVDGALVSLGTNGMSTLTAFVASYRSINTNLRALGIRKLFWTTITGRGYAAMEARMTSAAAASGTSIVTDVAITATSVMVGGGFAMEQVTATLPSTGSGPYTTTVTALGSAHEVGEPVWWGTQMILKRINNFIATVPDGINGVFDFEKEMEAAPHSSRMDLRYEASDKLHRRRRAQVKLASMVAPVLSRFKVGD